MTATLRTPSKLVLRTPAQPVAPALKLTPEQELALLARVLFREGYDDHLAGHITYKQEDGTFLVNPFGLPWDEVRASDVMRMDAEGNRLDGPWTITQAITLHVELHRARCDVTVAVHNHPQWSTVWAGMARVPKIYDQTSAFYTGEVAVLKEYRGAVDDADNARDVVAAMGSAGVALLANHGILIAAKDIDQAYLRGMSFEWRARQAWRIEALGGGQAVRPDVVHALGDSFNTNTFPGLFPAMARREIRRDPSVLS
ncbi:class II aldolase/adducin family protein [Mycobacterium heidelbergense]|uniref:class II aldolase/adducin family protein n=1 Tax=Mycobacterium heidelbergense TaxID=53376 RepID=UPI003CED5376